MVEWELLVFVWEIFAVAAWEDFVVAEWEYVVIGEHAVVVRELVVLFLQLYLTAL